MFFQPRKECDHEDDEYFYVFGGGDIDGDWFSFGFHQEQSQSDV